MTPSAPHDGRRAVIPALDGLRALAVLGVVTTHAAFHTGRYEHGWGRSLMARMDSGVTVFFVLSGFLLVRPWLARAAGSPRSPSLRTYALRRVARIMPPYLVAVVAALLLLPENATTTASDWVRHVLLLQIYGDGWLRHGLTQTWSLATEVSFYVLLPAIGGGLVAASRRGWRPGRLLALLSLGVLTSLAWPWITGIGAGGGWPGAGFWLPAHLGWFCGGMALAVVRTHLDRHPPPPASRWWFAESLGRHPLTCWSVSAGVYLVAMSPLTGPRSLAPSTAEAAATKHLLYLVVAVALVLPAVFGGSPVTRAVLANRVMRWCGDISYGVFLYHLVVLAGVMWLLDNDVFTGKVLQVLPLTVAGSCLVAWLSYRFLERPIIDRARRADPRGSNDATTPATESAERT